jgi:hypothetical protein
MVRIPSADEEARSIINTDLIVIAAGMLTTCR